MILIFALCLVVALGAMLARVVYSTREGRNAEPWPVRVLEWIAIVALVAALVTVGLWIIVLMGGG